MIITKEDYDALESKLGHPPTDEEILSASGADDNQTDETKAMTNATKAADELPAWMPEELDAMSEEFTDASNAPPTVEAKSYNPRQPRDDIGRWSDGAGGVSAGHAAHVMRSEGISDKDAAGVLSKIKDGTHTTREHVLKHIDSVHVMGKAPKRNGAYVGAAPFHSWNRVGGKGLAGSFYASDADVEGHSGAAWRQSQPVFSRMKFAADDKVLNVDATANPSASGEYAFAHLATARDRTDLDKLLRDHPDDLGLDLLFMDAVGALRAKEKGLAGIVSYDSGKVGDAVDLRDHSANELQTFVNKLLTNGLPKAEAKSWDDEETKRFNPNEPRSNDGQWSVGGGDSVSRSARKGVMRAATDEEKKSLGIPPAYTDVKITDDPNAELKATAKSAKGKAQYYYSAEYSSSQAAAKFERVKAIHHDLPAMRAKWNDEIGKNGKNTQEALTLRLISQTGFRIGGLDGGGDVEARGASSLKTTDAKVKGDVTEFDFTGKGGHRQHHFLTDAVLARHIESRQKSGADTIFDTNDAKTRDYLKATGGNYKAHDLRTRTASVMAAHYLGALVKRGVSLATPKAQKAAQNAIADKVAKKLGDTRSVVLSAYIDPQVWRAFDAQTG